MEACDDYNNHKFGNTEKTEIQKIRLNTGLLVPNGFDFKILRDLNKDNLL